MSMTKSQARAIGQLFTMLGTAHSVDRLTFSPHRERAKEYVIVTSPHLSEATFLPVDLAGEVVALLRDEPQRAAMIEAIGQARTLGMLSD